MAKLVSVIVPVYRAEAYLEACVQSILAQTYTDLEVILVDDGSPDGCGAICDRFASADARVHVIHQENSGVSAARNAGLDAAHGDYVTFTDSDDCPDPDMVQTMVDAMEQNEADLVTVNFRAVTPTQTKECVMHMQDAVLRFEKPDLAAVNSVWGTQASIFIWNCLYRAELIRRGNLRFRPMREVHSEDQLFNYCYYLFVRKAVCIGRSLYAYTKREDTLSHSEKPTELLDRRLTLMRVLRDFVRDNGLPKQSEQFYTLRTWTYFADGCTALRKSSRILEGIGQIGVRNRTVLRRCLRGMLFGKAGKTYMRACGMDRRARLYFKAMLALMLAGKYDRPVRTYLAKEG